MLNDVNLEQWSASTDGSTCSFRFLHRHGGAPAGVLKCTDVVLLNYHNIRRPALDNSSEHPIYLKTVLGSELAGAALLARLKELRFHFSHAPNSAGQSWAERRLFHVQMDGGYLHIDVLCQDYRLTQIE